MHNFSQDVQSVPVFCVRGHIWDDAGVVGLPDWVICDILALEGPPVIRRDLIGANKAEEKVGVTVEFSPRIHQGLVEFWFCGPAAVGHFVFEIIDVCEKLADSLLIWVSICFVDNVLTDISGDKIA